MEKEEVDRRRGGKTISKSEQGWTLPAEDRTRWKGAVAKSPVVLQRSCKVMELIRLDVSDFDLEVTGMCEDGIK